VDGPFILFVQHQSSPEKRADSAGWLFASSREAYKQDVQLVLAGGKGWLFEDV